MKDKTALFTTIIFWIGFGSFLATSIPHVAWLYQVYEPINLDGSRDWYTIVTSYGIAIGIDVMIAWLSFICAKGKVIDWGVTVVFIVLLSGLSQYANFLYAMAHDPVHQVNMWNIGLLWGLTTTGYLTPIIISGVPFFSLAYTFMLSRLDRSMIDVKALEKQLENRQEVKKLREKYQAQDKESLEEKAKQTLTSVVSVVKHAIKEVSNNTSTEAQTHEQNEVNEEVNEVSEDTSNEDLNVPQTGSTSRRYIPLEEAASMLQYDVSTVRRMVTQKKLKTAPKSDQLVSTASVNNLLTRRQTLARKTISEVFERVEQDTEEIAIPITESDQRVGSILELVTQDFMNV